MAVHRGIKERAAARQGCRGRRTRARQDNQPKGDILLPIRDRLDDELLTINLMVEFHGEVRRSSNVAAALASARRFDEAVAVARSRPRTLAATVKSGE